MAFEGLTEKLQGALRKLSSKGKLTEDNVKEGMREVRMALLEADVNYAVAKDFIKKVTARCVGTEITGTLSASQQVIKIVNEEMTQLMGGENARLTWSSGPLTVYMLCGLQGAGKTTMAAKLANYLAKQGKKPMLAACDIYRPAAINQLQVVGKQVNVPVYEHGTQDPVKTALEAVERARYLGPRRADYRHRRPPAHRSGADGRARPHQGKCASAGNPAGGRRHDRSGRGQRRPDL